MLSILTWILANLFSFNLDKYVCLALLNIFLYLTFIYLIAQYIFFHLFHSFILFIHEKIIIFINSLFLSLIILCFCLGENETVIANKSIGVNTRLNYQKKKKKKKKTSGLAPSNLSKHNACHKYTHTRTTK